MANGSLFGDIKSRLGFGERADDVVDDDYEDYDDGYDGYGEDYDGYDDGYDNRYEQAHDPYMERGRVTTRSGRGGISSIPRLVSMEDARESARSISTLSGKSEARSSAGSFGRTMVDSSLPPTMTAEGTAAVSEASNRRAEGLNSLFGSGAGSSAGRISAGSNSVSSRLSGGSEGASLRSSIQVSMPGQRQLQVIRPQKYDDAEAVTNVLKSGDAAIIVFANTDRALMKRILDFSFGAASALDATVEHISSGVFAICRNVGLDDRERADLRAQGIG